MRSTCPPHPGVCWKLVSKGLAPAKYIIVFVLAFGSMDGQDVLIYGCMCIDIFDRIQMYRLYKLIFSVMITKGSGKLTRGSREPLQLTPALMSFPFKGLHMCNCLPARLHIMKLFNEISIVQDRENRRN
jgi:hypothetical protein